MGGPLILTLQLDERSQSFYEELRRRYFPAERNVIPAHLTLFHQLPAEERIVQTLGEAAGANLEFPLTGAAARSIGRGVAVFFQSEQLRVMHGALSEAFASDLIAQDRQRLRPHIVVQNKVDGATARETLAQVQALALLEPRAVGLTLWRYLGGPWERLDDLPFGDATPGGEAPVPAGS